MERINVRIFWSSGQEDQLGAMYSSVEEAFRSLNLGGTPIALLMIKDDADAVQKYVFGTPSMKINDIDMEQDLMMYEKPGLWSRKYMLAGKEIPAPTISTIKEALIMTLARQRVAACGSS